MNKLKSYISKSVSSWYLIAFSMLGFFLPLIFGTPTNELYEFPKMYFVYFAGGALLTAFLVMQVLHNRKFVGVPLYIKLYLLSFIASTVFSMHVYTSFWGYYTRFSDCLMSTFLFFGLYYVAKSKLTSRAFESFFKISLISIIPVSILAISQHGDLLRVYSTFGQANWLAQYIVFLLPAVLYFYMESDNSGQEDLLQKRAELGLKADIPYYLSGVWFVTAVLGFCALWFTYSLSGLLGFIASMLMMLVLFGKKWLFNSKEPARVKVFRLKLLLFAAVAGLIAATNMGVFTLRFQDALRDVKNIFQSRLIVYAQSTESTSSASPASDVTQRNLSDPGYIRGGLWRGTLDLIFSVPKVTLIGTGPETFPYAFQPFRPRELNYSSEWNFVFNKPHNFFLEIASEQGLVGLLIYLYIVFVLLKRLPKKYLPGFIGFVVTNFFGWPSVYTSFLFWMLLASLELKEQV